MVTPKKTFAQQKNDEKRLIGFINGSNSMPYTTYHNIIGHKSTISTNHVMMSIYCLCPYSFLIYPLVNIPSLLLKMAQWK